MRKDELEDRLVRLEQKVTSINDWRWGEGVFAGRRAITSRLATLENTAFGPDHEPCRTCGTLVKKSTS